MLLTDVSIEDYHDRLTELGSSTLKLANSEGWRVAFESQYIESESTAALRLGSAVHAVVDGSFADRYAAAPAEYKTTSSQKFAAWLDDMAAAGKVGLTAAEYAEALELGAAVQKAIDPIAFGATKYVEPTILWTHQTQYGPVECKCRPDLLFVDRAGVARYIEVKTAQKNGYRAWRSASYQFDYALQQAHYESGIATEFGRVETVFVVVRKSKPVVVRKYRYSDLDILAARRIWSGLMDEYARRNACGDWDDDSITSPTVVSLGLDKQIPELQEEMSDAG